MSEYQLINDPMTCGISETVLRVADQAYIPNDPANRDRAEYETWVAAGNVPDPPPVQAQASVAADQRAHHLEEARKLVEHGHTKQALGMLIDLLKG